MQPQTDFAIIPTAEELSRIDRDVRFFQADPSVAKTLSSTDVERYNRDGYLAPLDVYSADEIAKHREFFDEILRQTLAQGKDSYSISTAHLKYRQVWDILCEPRIVRYVTDLLGENVIGWGAHFFCKLPGDGKSVDWHQDCSYWPLTPTKGVTVWLAIDDADVENGCMEVICGSQTRGLIGYRESGESSGNVLNQSVDNPDQYGRRVVKPLRAGQMSLHSDLLLHGSMPNNSQRRRCGLTLRYSTADVEAHLGWNRKGVVVAGRADPTRWPGATRPNA